MLVKHANVFREEGIFEVGDIAISGAYFADASPDNTVLDASGCYAIPGLIDIHLHGCMGHEFSDANAQQLQAMARFQAASGVTAICPSTLTLPEAHLAAACKRLAAFHDPEGAAFVGIHLEGPFLSPKKVGAQNPAYIHPPDLDMFRRLQQASGGLVKRLAIAPEIEGAMELIAALKDEISCSIAHTTADYETAKRAFEMGAAGLTHLFNAMPPLHHRDPGVIGAALDTPGCRVELICDNVHVHPSAVRAAIAMFGKDRVIFISDSIMAAGLPDQVCQMGGLEVEIKGNLACIAGTSTIAGSISNLMGCLYIAVTETGIPLETAVTCASINPAKAIGIYDKHGSIQPGKYADLVLLREDLSIRGVILRGKLLGGC